MTTGTSMRKGRTRKAGNRHPSGDLILADVRSVVMAQPHRRGLPVKKDENGRIKTDLRMDQKAENLLGLLSLHKVITEPEYEAGKKYSEVVARYRIAIAAPFPLMSPTAGSGGDITKDQKQRWTAAYEAAERVLSLTGHDTFAPTRLVAVYGLPITQGQIPNLRVGLQALAHHFGLTNHGKSHPLGNRS